MASKNDKNVLFPLTKPTLFNNKVQPPKNPFITKPAKMHFISEIPEPAAYGANDFIR